MVKIVVRLDLSNYSLQELFNLYRLKVLSTNEVIAEMRNRGMQEIEIIGRIRAAG